MSQSGLSTDMAAVTEFISLIPGLAEALAAVARKHERKREGAGGAEPVEVVGQVAPGPQSVGVVPEWSDEVNDDEAECSAGSESSSVEMPEGASGVSAAVKAAVKFGGVADHYESTDRVQGEREAASGFMKTYVKSPNVLALREFVEKRAGCRVPKAVMTQFALCAYSTATVPVEFKNGKERLRQFAVAGDAALTLHVVMDAIARGDNVGSVQAARSKLTADASLSKICVGSGMSAYVSFPAGVDLGTSKVTADAMEVVIGFLVMYRDTANVKSFLRSMQLVG